MTSAYVHIVQIFTSIKRQMCEQQSTMLNCSPDDDARAQAMVGPGLAMLLHTITSLPYTVKQYKVSSLAIPFSAVLIVMESEDGLFPTCVAATIEHLYS